MRIISADPSSRIKENGNIFLTLFAGVAMVGILGATTMNFMQGPLRTSVKLTRQNAAETQMLVGAQVSVMAAANTANSGDCDADGMIEPLEYLSPGTTPVPVGGGLIPMNIGIAKKDPWGTAYGYCVWDFGTASLQASCQTTSGTNKRLQGSTNPAYPVVALVSAGPDKVFTTTCRNFSTGATRADQNNNGVLTDSGDYPLIGKANETDDDIIFSYTYQEAMAASGGLWTLKSGAPGTAVISKDLEVSGGATFSGTGTFDRLAATGSDYLEVVSGLKLGSAAVVAVCDTANNGVLRLAADNKSIEICDGTAAPPAWKALGAGGDTTTMMSVTATGPYTKTAVGDFDIYQFTGNGSLQVTALGNDPSFGSQIEFLMVGGGGGSNSQAAAGAGGVIANTMTAVVQNYPIVVGAGGAMADGAASDGGNTTFAGFTARGGGGAGVTNVSGGRNGASGGGGSGGGTASTPGGTGYAGQGYAGCNGYQSAVSNYYSGGGGGGAGGPCPGTRQPGPGISSSITGTSVMYACGGQGRDLDSANMATTGAAGCASSVSAAPAPNRGHGGGGSGTVAAKAGSAGVVILKIKQRGGTATSSMSYPLKAPDGSAAAPSYSFNSQQTKGMFIDSGNVKISGLAAPTANDQAANKEYVDTVVAAAGAGGGGGSITKRMEVVTASTNTFPACPANYTAIGCLRSGATADSSLYDDDVLSGIFQPPTGVAANKSFLMGNAAVITPYEVTSTSSTPTTSCSAGTFSYTSYSYFFRFSINASEVANIQYRRRRTAAGTCSSASDVYYPYGLCLCLQD